MCIARCRDWVMLPFQKKKEDRRKKQNIYNELGRQWAAMLRSSIRTWKVWENAPGYPISKKVHLTTRSKKSAPVQRGGSFTGLIWVRPGLCWPGVLLLHLLPMAVEVVPSHMALVMPPLVLGGLLGPSSPTMVAMVTPRWWLQDVLVYVGRRQIWWSMTHYLRVRFLSVGWNPCWSGRH
jgi:hypothetical protein